MSKKYSEYTINDLLRLKASFIYKDNGEKLEPELLKGDTAKQLDALLHTKNVALSMGVNVGNQPALELIGDSERKNRVLTDKRKLGEIIIRYCEGYSEGDAFNNAAAIEYFVEKDGLQLSDKRSSIKSEISDCKRRIDNTIESVKSKQRDLDGLFKKIAERETKMVELGVLLASAKDTDLKQGLKDVINTVVDGGKWDFIGSDDSHLYFVLRNTVVCHHVNKAAGIDLHEDLGYFYARIYIYESGGIQLRPYKNGKYNSGTQHPHASGTSVCWGDAREEALTYMKTQQYDKLLSLAECLLTQYSDVNPYRGLSSWRTIKPEVDTVKERVNADTYKLFTEYNNRLDYAEYERIEAERKAKEEEEERKRYKTFDTNVIGVLKNKAGCNNTSSMVFKSEDSNRYSICVLDKDDGTISRSFRARQQWSAPNYYTYMSESEIKDALLKLAIVEEKDIPVDETSGFRLGEAVEVIRPSGHSADRGYFICTRDESTLVKLSRSNDIRVREYTQIKSLERDYTYTRGQS